MRDDSVCFFTIGHLLCTQYCASKWLLRRGLTMPSLGCRVDTACCDVSKSHEAHTAPFHCPAGEGELQRAGGPTPAGRDSLAIPTAQLRQGWDHTQYPVDAVCDILTSLLVHLLQICGKWGRASISEINGAQQEFVKQSAKKKKKRDKYNTENISVIPINVSGFNLLAETQRPLALENPSACHLFPAFPNQQH